MKTFVFPPSPHTQVWADETKRLEFAAEKNDINGFLFGHIGTTRREQTDDARLDVASVELKPFEIRTFQFEIGQK